MSQSSQLIEEREHSPTGSYFIFTYPPFSTWDESRLGEGAEVRVVGLDGREVVLPHVGARIHVDSAREPEVVRADPEDGVRREVDLLQQVAGALWQAGLLRQTDPLREATLRCQAIMWLRRSCCPDPCGSRRRGSVHGR